MSRRSPVIRHAPADTHDVDTAAFLRVIDPRSAGFARD